MGLFFQSEEEIAAEQAALRAQRDAEAQAAKQREYLSSPLGQAEAAKQQGLRFLEVQIEVGLQRREAYFGTRDSEIDERVLSSAGVLEAIENLGWHLEHANYIFKVTGQSSSEKMFLSGEETSVSGATIGIYLFRSTDTGAPHDQTAAPASY